MPRYIHPSIGSQSLLIPPQFDNFSAVPDYTMWDGVPMLNTPGSSSPSSRSTAVHRGNTSSREPWMLPTVGGWTMIGVIRAPNSSYNRNYFGVIKIGENDWYTHGQWSVHIASNDWLVLRADGEYVSVTTGTDTVLMAGIRVDRSDNTASFFVNGIQYGSAKTIPASPTVTGDVQFSLFGMPDLAFENSYPTNGSWMMESNYGKIGFVQRALTRDEMANLYAYFRAESVA